MNRFAGIIVNNEAVQLDRIFTYIIPDELLNKIEIGHRVKVPFGRGDRLIDGFVIKLINEFDGDEKVLKSINKFADKNLLFDIKAVELIEYMREKYLCTYIDAIKTIIPTGTIKGLSSKVSEVICIGKNLEKPYDKEIYKQIFKVVNAENGIYNRNQLNKLFNISLSSINTLVKNGFLIKETKIIDRFNGRSYDYYEEKVLNDEQEHIIQNFLNDERKVSLIHGITGSGKTEVYMKMVSFMIDKNKQSIILVPEIALTPQMIERFKGRFGKDIAIFHSRLSEGERYDEWFRVKEGRVKLAIGARSAVFLPFQNLGLIVIDEEHESSYKSDSSPKYDAREIAEFICVQRDAKLVLGTATPSLETYYRASNNEIALFTMKNRVDGGKLPTVEIVDMREELIANNRSIFSRKLYIEMKKSLEAGEQVMIFLNRRGFSTFVSCRKCGYVFKCSKCDISMTYHLGTNKLECHYCGSQTSVSKTCPKCGSIYVKYFGAGTEKIEMEIKKYFPKFNVLRMDFDTTRKKDSHEKIYNAFKNGEAQILVGTQMIAKGLDFPNVTVVGVLAADITLNLPDYKASERTFQLMTQVSGRAGRGDKEGKVIIQTYTPEHYSLIDASNNDYDGFYNKEINIRKYMNYPPFSKILLINGNSKNEESIIKFMQELGLKIKYALEHKKDISVLGPCPSSISKIKELYRWQIILKGNIESSIAQEIKKIIYSKEKQDYNDIRISMDINPSSIL